MKGRFQVTATSKRVEYRFSITRKYTIIRGDSATGKTTLYNMLLDFERGERSISFHSDVPCVSANYLGGRWDLVLPTVHNSIVFIDEDSKWVRSKQFAEAAKVSDNYFVIIGRYPLPMIPYSVHEIYDIKTSGHFHYLKPIFTSKEFEFTPDCILTEDSDSGFQFFSSACKNCMSAKGKSNIFPMLHEHKYPGNDCLVVADGAAFGSEIERVAQLKNFCSRRVKLYLPESFEYMLLKLPMFSTLNRVKKVLANPADFIDTTYNSWEQFFTAFLCELTLGTPAGYTKASLSACYVSPCCCKLTPCKFLKSGDKKAALLSLISNVDFSRIRKEDAESKDF